MPTYPIHPCCYCGRTEAGLSCTMGQKVNCRKYQLYLQKLHNMKAQPVLIRELKYLLKTKYGDS